MLISPSESPTLRALGTSTWRCEDYGADIMWYARKRSFGVQRKALKDLVASVDDGRLSKEILQMQSLDVAVLIVESGERGGGMPREGPGGQLMGLGGYGRAWTGRQLRGVLWGVMDRGVRVEWTRDEPETIARVLELEAWSRKERHESARGRGSAPRDVFGKRGSREYGVWVMQGWPGVGVELAGRMWDEFGGVPLQMREGVGVAELMKVKGVGKTVAKKVVDMFGGEE